MQNARLSELEKLLAKSSAKPSPVKVSTAAKSSEEFNKLKEENRVVSFPGKGICTCNFSLSIWVFIISHLCSLEAYGGNGCVAGASRRVRERN